ncbi:hypothetical protein WJX77_002850 [Trebouxia sp. C0004]
MDSVLHDLLWKTVMVYLDDIINFTRTWEDHLAVLDDVLQRLRAAGLKASPGKCAFGQGELLYLGHLVTGEGILPDPANIMPIMNALPPLNITTVQTFQASTWGSSWQCRRDVQSADRNRGGRLHSHCTEALCTNC